VPNQMERLVTKVSENMTQSQLFFTILLMGAISGGGGQLLLGNMFRDETARLQAQEAVEAIQRIERQLILTRCEIRALRENYEWWTCYTGADNPGMGGVSVPAKYGTSE